MKCTVRERALRTTNPNKYTRHTKGAQARMTQMILI